MMPQIAQAIIIISGIWLITVSTFMFVRPRTALCFLRKAASTNLINYTELTLRGIWGIALLLYTNLSRYPGFFHLFGIVICFTTLVLFFIPRRWHAKYAVWWSGKLQPVFIRACAPFSFAFGVFLIYAVL